MSTRGFTDPDNRWSAIERTLHETASPAGSEQIRDLVGRSMQAYWAGARQTGEARDQEREAARSNRRMITVLDRWLPARAELFWDFVLAAVPVALALVTFPLLRNAQLEIPEQLPLLGSVVAVLLASLATAVFIRSRPDWLRYSLGALLAGVVMSVFVGSSLARQASASRDLSLRLAQKELTAISLSSLRHRLDSGSFLRAHVSADLLSIQSRLSGEEAVYTASGSNLPGTLEVNLRDSSGELRWARRGHEDLRLLFTSGQVASVLQGTWKLQELERPLKADPLVGVQPEPGTCVVIAYDPETEIIQQALRCRDDPKTAAGTGLAQEGP